jgi:hypothetical protein
MRPHRFPAGWPGTLRWWRRGDSTFRGFRSGLDYAFIRNAQMSTLMRSVLSERSNHPNPSARPGDAVGESMSLYRAGLKLALFLPLGVAMPLCFSRAPSGFTDVSSVFSQSSRIDATH